MTDPVETLFETLKEMDPVELSLHIAVLEAQDDHENDNNHHHDDETHHHDSSSSFTEFILTVERQRKRNHYFKLFKKLPTSQFGSLFDSLQRLPSLKHLRLSTETSTTITSGSNNNDNNSLCLLSRLAAILKSCALESLYVTRGISIANSKSLEVLLEALTNHPTLRSVSLFDVHVDVLPSNHHKQHEAAAAPLDDLVYALSTIPNLECVDTSLQEWDNDAAAARRARRRRCRRRRVLGVPLQDPSSSFSTTWKPSSTQVDTTTQVVLVSPEAIRTLLCRPPKLQEVSLWNWNLTDHHIRHGFCPALIPNHAESSGSASASHVRFLSLRQNPAISDAAWNALFQTVVDGQNYTLHHVVSDDMEPSEEQNFYLHLNQQDRAELMASITAATDAPANKNHTTCYSEQRPSADETWCNILDLFGDQPDALYYWTQQAAGTLLAQPISSR